MRTHDSPITLAGVIPTCRSTREQAMSAEQAQKFRYFVLIAKPGDAALQRWMTQQHKQVLSRFANRKGDTVLVIGD
jgi:hypothetical protein